MSSSARYQRRCVPSQIDDVVAHGAEVADRAELDERDAHLLRRGRAGAAMRRARRRASKAAVTGSSSSFMRVLLAAPAEPGLTAPTRACLADEAR